MKFPMDIAKLGTDDTHQIVILPEEFQMTGTEVYIKKLGNTLVLISKDNPWQSLFESLNQFSEDFMAMREQPPLDNREAF